MTIVLYTRNLQGRGVQKVYLNLAKAFQKLGHAVHFVISEDIIDFNYSFIENFYLFYDNHINQLDLLLSKLENPILITSDAKSANKLQNIPKINTYYTVHMLWSTRIFKQIRVKKFFQLHAIYTSKNIFFASKAAQDDFKFKLKIHLDYQNVVYGALDIKQVKLKSLEKIDLSFPYILNIGALSREKNHKLLISTYCKLDLDEHLVILGEGKLRPKLEKMIKRLNLEDKVHLLVWKENPYPYIKQASLFVSTSDNEALHGSVIESIILGIPVVSMDSIGVREVMVGELSKYIVKRKSNLVYTIKDALANYPIINNTYVDKFDYINIASKYIKEIKIRMGII